VTGFDLAQGSLQTADTQARLAGCDKRSWIAGSAGVSSDGLPVECTMKPPTRATLPVEDYRPAWGVLHTCFPTHDKRAGVAFHLGAPSSLPCPACRLRCGSLTRAQPRTGRCMTLGLTTHFLSWREAPQLLL